MRSILRKAMWPAALVAGMFVLLGAIGTGTAPIASAEDWDYCAQYGPIPAEIGPDFDDVDDGPWENEFLLEGRQYLIILAVEDEQEGLDEVNVEIDDETGDADIVYYADGDGTPDNNVDELVAVNHVDSLNGLPNWFSFNWDEDGDDQLLDDIQAEFGIYYSGYNWQCGDGGVYDGLSFIVVECDRHGTFEITHYDDDNDDAQSYTEEYICLDDPAAMTLTATPTTVESHPAIGNVSHSLIVAVVTDSDGNYVGENYEVDWTTTGCKIEGLDEYYYEDFVKELFSDFDLSIPETGAAINLFLGPDWDHPPGLTTNADSFTFLHDGSPAPGYQPETRAAAVLHCEGADPGTVTVKAEIEDDQFGQRDDQDIAATVEVTVVGPPAFINMVAEPTELVCGEKAQILVTVTDALDHAVSDHTRVELITNYGGVLGGTGSSLGYPGVNPVNPLSSSAAETFGGVATAYLLTSTNHIGSYEVVAAAGGSTLGAYTVAVHYESKMVVFDDGDDDYDETPTADLDSSDNLDSRGIYYYYGNTGIFSTPVVTSQVTVTCTEAAAPEVTAPDTGTGTISPPNTGDGGLASGTAGSATLLVIAGAVAFVVASFAKLGVARR